MRAPALDPEPLGFKSLSLWFGLLVLELSRDTTNVFVQNTTNSI